MTASETATPTGKPSTSTAMPDVAAVVDAIVNEFGADRTRLMDIVQAIQCRLGYIPDTAVHAIAAGLGIHAVQVEDMVSFYAFSNRSPKGRFHIRLSKTPVCREAFVSQHIGDLGTTETVTFYRETISHLLSALDVKPERVICDLHPDYRSTRIAEEIDLPCVRVQHHAAHVAAVAGEHGLTGRVLGLALDGYGMGPEGENWGGELLMVEGAKWRRLGGLFPLPLPGGDLAAREPARMAAAALAALGRTPEITHRFRELSFARPMAAYLSQPGLCPVTSSMGRLFDAASGLLGLCPVQAYEGQAATELEALVTDPRIMPGGFTLDQGVLDFRPLLSILADGIDPREGANLFHGTLIAGLAAWVATAGETTVVLGGGCFANRVLTEGLRAALAWSGITAHLARKLPPGDGGLSFGQAIMGRG